MGNFISNTRFTTLHTNQSSFVSRQIQIPDLKSKCCPVDPIQSGKLDTVHKPMFYSLPFKTSELQTFLINSTAYN